MSDSQNQWNQQIIDEFRANDGNVTTAGFGRSLVLVHHTGAQTGIKRINPLRSVHKGNGTWLIVASKQGASDNPDWYHNLKAKPNAEIETPTDGTFPVRAEVLSGEAREQAWKEFTAANPVFRDYQQQTERIFPVLALHRQ